MRPLALWSVLPLLIALAFVAGRTAPAPAAEVRNSELAASDGYGVQECLAEAEGCGPAMADAWCAAQGRGRAVSYGPIDDVNRAAPGAASAPIEAGAYFITCSD